MPGQDSEFARMIAVYLHETKFSYEVRVTLSARLAQSQAYAGCAPRGWLVVHYESLRPSKIEAIISMEVFMSKESVVVPRYLSPRQAATYLGMSVWSLYRLVSRRAVPFIPLRPGRRGVSSSGRASLRFDSVALDSWMRRQTIKVVDDSVDRIEEKSL